jgi:hypothetical protein
MALQVEGILALDTFSKKLYKLFDLTLRKGSFEGKLRKLKICLGAEGPPRF